MSEFIVIQVGQCGNQIGRCLLPEILQEYDVKINGGLIPKCKRDKIDLQQFFSSFFNCNNTSMTYDALNDLIKDNVKAREEELVLALAHIFWSYLRNIIQKLKGTEDVITCPYNMAFATQELLNNATCVFPVENRALLDITLKQNSWSKLNFKPASLFKPFEDMNSIIVDMILHLTSGSRFGGKMNIDINEINTNMVPFPQLNFLTSGFSPFILKSFPDNSRKHLKNEIFFASCSRSNQLIKVDPLDSRYTSMSVTLLGRGNYSVNDMRNYVDKLKPKIHFPFWSGKAVKLGLCNVPPKGLDFSMFSLYNTSSISALFQEVLSQFMKLYKKKAHLHHYTAISGFEYSCFGECQETLTNIIQSYRDVELIKPLL